MSDCIHYQLGFDLVLWGKIIHLAKSSQKLASVALKKSGLVLKKKQIFFYDAFSKFPQSIL